MPKVNKTLHGNVDEIAAKLKHGIASFGNMIAIRDEWSTDIPGGKCILQVYEKLNLEPDTFHLSMSVVLVDTGEEIRLCATTSGGSNQYFANPYPAGEGELTGVLGVVLGSLDAIIM